MAANQIDQCHYISPAVAALGAAGGYGLGAGLSALAGGGGSGAASGSGGLTGAADDVAAAVADDVAAAADDVVLSGHGAFVEGSGTVVVPQGTTLTTYTGHGQSISDTLGNFIETGTPINMAQFGDEVLGATTHLPGATVPNYTLYPPTGLNIMGNPVTVSQPTTLNTLLQPNMGHVHWAACLACVP